MQAVHSNEKPSVTYCHINASNLMAEMPVNQALFSVLH